MLSRSSRGLPCRDGRRWVYRSHTLLRGEGNLVGFRVHPLPPVAPAAYEPPLSSLSSPSLRSKGGPTFPSVIAPSKTAAFHMKAHAAPVPDVGPLDAELHRIEVPDETGAQHNPSVCTVDGELVVIVRVLYRHETINYAARVADDWELEEIVRVDARPFGRGDLKGYVQVEDMRIFHWRDRLWAIAAVHDGMRPPSAIRQALLELNRDGSEVLNAYVQHSTRHEKNWMPIVDGDTLRLVYSTEPLITMTINSAYRAVPGAPSTHQATGHVRGGSQLIPWGGGWLGIVHQVYKPPQDVPCHNRLLSDFWVAPAPHPISGDAKIVYIHRFALFDRKLEEVVYGKPWYWRTPGIEFCAGLTRWRDRLVASFGVADKEAWLAEIADEVVWDTFDAPGEGA